MKRCYSKRLSLLLLFFAGLSASFQSVAQYTPSVIETGGTYTAVATDKQDAVYVVAYNSTSGMYEVHRYADGSTGTYFTVYAALAGAGVDHSWGIAVNSHGDVYITNPNTTNHWEIIKLAAGTYVPSVIQSGQYYTAITTDANDNLLTLEYDGTANYQVVRYSAGAGETLPGTVLYNGIPVGAGDGTYPWGIVTDKQNNIYILDRPNSASNGRVIKLTAPGYAPTNLLSGKSYSALAIDAAGNLYTSELASGNTYHVMKYAASALTAGTEIYTGLSIGPWIYPWGLAVNGHGDVFVNDPAALSGTGKFIKLTSDPVAVKSVIRASPNPTGATTVDFTVTFSAPVSNVTPSAFSITTTGGISGSPHVTGITGSGTTYTVTVNTGTGNGTLQLGVNGISMLNNFSNIPFSDGEVYTIVRTATPTGSLTINSGAAYTNNPAVTLAITSANADQMHFANEGDPYGPYEPITATKSYNLSSGDGLKTVHMQLKDAAGHELVVDATITLDQSPPNTTITSGPPSFSNSSQATFTFESTESNSFYETSLDGGIYTLSANPAIFSGFGDGLHTVSVRAIDPAGNVDPTPVLYNWVVDRNPPAVTAVEVPDNGYYTTGDILDFSVKLSESVAVDFTGGKPYIDVTIGSETRHAPYSGGSGDIQIFSYPVQPGDMDLDGITLGTTVVLNGGAIRDGAGNDALPTLHAVGNTTQVFVNTAAPGVMISSAATSPVNQPVTATITFTEAVTGFTIGDIIATNATLSNLQQKDAVTYTALVTPTTDGAVSVQVPAGVAVNTGNNGNTASNTLNFTYDGTAPAVTSVDVPANGIYKGKDVLSFLVHYSENLIVTGKPSFNVVIGGATRQAVYTSGSGTNSLAFSYKVIEGDMDMDGITPAANINLNGGTIRDLAGNNALTALNNMGSTAEVLVNTAIPQVVVSTTATSPVNKPFTISIVFSEAVTGFTESDIVTTNATLSNFQTTDNITYTVLATPDAEGEISAEVPAAAAVNIGNNSNTASNKLTLDFDDTPPIIKPGQQGTVDENSANGTDVATVTATDGNPATIFSHWTITGGNADHVFAIDPSTGEITVADGSKLDFETTTAYTLTLTVSDGINTSAAETVIIHVNDLNDNTPLIKPGQSFNAAESSANGTNIGMLVATDADAGTVFSDWTIAGGDPDHAFAINPSTGEITVADGDKLDFETTTAYTLTLTVSDGLHTSAAETVIIHVNDLNDNAPVIKSGQSFSIDENSANGTGIGTVKATDADAGTIFSSWMITGGDTDHAFAINPSTGKITVADGSKLDFETMPTYTLTLTVSDGTHTSAVETVSIHLNDLDEAPSDINLSPEPLYENQPAGTSAGTLSSTAQDAGATFTYSLVPGTGDADNSLFQIKGSAIATAIPLDYEQKSSYHIRVRSALPNGLYVEKSLTILVDDVNEAPTLDAISDLTACYDGTQQVIRLSGISAGEDQGQTTSLSVSADNAALFKSLTASGNKIAYTLAEGTGGTATVTVTIKDDGGTANGGSDQMSRSFTLTVNPLPVITITADSTNPVSKGIPTRLTASGADSYQWASGPGIQNGWNDATLVIRPQQDATYTVTGTSAGGCTTQQQYALAVVADYQLICNNIVSPNGDGKNDTWIIQNVDSYPNNEVMIYDRSGRMIYRKKQYDNQWNGILNGGTLVEGTYYYVFIVDGGKKIFKGYIELLTGRR